MKKLPAILLGSLCSLFILSFFINNSNDVKVIGYGTIKYNNKKISGVSLKILEKGKVVGRSVTGRSGIFGFSLDLNTEYDIIVAKEGYLKEIVHINTRVPDEVIAYGADISWDIDLTPYKIIPGLNKEEIKEPVANYFFDIDYWGFIEDKKYKEKVSPELSDLKENIEELKIIAGKSENQKADSLFTAKNYEEAIIAYNQVLEYNPDNKELEKKIKQTQKLLKKQISVNEGYEQAIKKADDLLAEDELDAANNYYQKALIYKPNETYPLDRLYEIDSLKSYWWIAKNNSYESAVLEADSLYNTENYEASKNTYLDALDIFPKKIYPKQMLNKIDSIIDLLESQKRALAQAHKDSIQAFLSEKKDKELKITDEKAHEDKVHQKKGEEIVAITESTSRKTDIKGTSNTETKKEESEQDKSSKEQIISVEDKEPVDTKEVIEEHAAKENDDTLKTSILTTQKAQESLKQLEMVLQEKINSDDKEGSSKILKEMGAVYQSEFQLGKALESYSRSLDITREVGNKEEEAEVLSDIATVLYDSGSYNDAIEHFEKSLEISEDIDDKEQTAKALTNIATVYENTYRYDEALDYLNRSLDIKLETKDKEGAGVVHKNMANIYYEQNNFEKAIQSLEKSLEIDKETDNKEEISATLNNLGATYYNMNDLDKAIEYYEKSLSAAQENNNLRDQSITLNNLGNINFNNKKYKAAIDYYERSIRIKEQISFREGIATSLHNIGNAYYELKDYEKALEYYDSSLKISEEINYREVIWKNYQAYAKTYAKLGNFRKAYDYYQKYTSSKYEAAGQAMQLVELREQYESSKVTVQTLKRELQKQNRIARYEAERNKREMQIIELEVANKLQQLKRQRIIIISFFIGSILILAFSVIITRQYRQKNKAYRIVAEQKKHITDGITYARRIQQAVLPPDKYIENILPDRFIINKPREVVGGDFYWAAKHYNKTVVAVADCTGHGVPGGFMSMLGIAILNEIISIERPLESHEILTHLRDRVIDALHQRDRLSEALDGMDISLLVYDPEKKEVQFSAAYHSLYLMRENQLKKIKGDRVPIGYHFKIKPFTSQTIKVKKGDMIYMSTDGYTDQIGEKTNERFMLSRFKEQLISVHDKPLNKQKEMLEQTLFSWKGNQEQTDDILVMGLKIT
ncbi:MAG: tetratricopeptide repeat protein [Bacteroidales bacterium]|nr:tetratricopeptide repeat protein [Bacteroidales bacterium]